MRSRFNSIFFGILILIVTSFWFVPKAQALPHSSESSHVRGCLACHGQDNFNAELENGEFISLTINQDHNQNSVHQAEGIVCETCHQDYARDPHPAPDNYTCEYCHSENMAEEDVELGSLSFTLPYKNQRDMSISWNQVCRNCHENEAEKTSDSTHQMVFDQGNLSAPLCIDCHGSHQVEKPNQPRSKISTVCAECHKSVFTTYEGSVHGAALIGEGNLDVPSCVDCHGVHNISGPYDITFREASTIMCTTCHANEKLMAPYGISTLLADTYLSEFHGRSANLFIFNNSNRPSDKAVCFDCHGIHNILAPDNPVSQVYPENLLGTCQKCHLDTDITFPDEWLGHYAPTFEDNPVLYLINIIYPVIISLVIGGSIVYIFLDARKRYSIKKETADNQGNENVEKKK